MCILANRARDNYISFKDSIVEHFMPQVYSEW